MSNNSKKKNIDDKEKPSFSVRAMGQINDSKDGEIKITHITPITYDWVFMPSHLHKKRSWYKELWDKIKNIKCYIYVNIIFKIKCKLGLVYIYKDNNKE